MGVTAARLPKAEFLEANASFLDTEPPPNSGTSPTQ